MGSTFDGLRFEAIVGFPLIQVGYVPHSKDLQHPADRRRLAFWAAEENLKLIIENPLDSDILVLSSAANFGYWLKRARQPVIIDLVDGYLGENPSFIKDFLRNTLRTVGGTSSFRWITYTRHLRYACELSTAVVVASIEQRELVRPLNKNVVVILDNHSELATSTLDSANIATKVSIKSNRQYVFWEGFGYTLKHFAFMSGDLDHFLQKFNCGMYLVTVKEFPRWGGYIGKVQTRTLIKKMFPLSWKSIEIIPWSIENLSIYANKSLFGIIPIDSGDKFATLKSENKLLSMWCLGLPVLFSKIPSYSRVAASSNSEFAGVLDEMWTNKLQYLFFHPEQINTLRNEGSAYVALNHSKEILLKAWGSTIRDVYSQVSTSTSRDNRKHQ